MRVIRVLVLLLVTGACGNRSESAPPPTPGSPPAKAEVQIDAGAPTSLVVSPHTGQIAILAVTDDAKAAISADETGELRFWPSLDGKHEPVVIHGRPPVAMAIADENDGHVAVLLDSADGVELLHINADGALRSRQVVSGEPGFEELAAGATAILARRSDHTIVRLDSASKGQVLAPQQGEQILGIAARRNIAVAAIADHERPAEIRYVRQIALGNTLAWGVAYELPAPLSAPIAISPSGKRIAGINARTGAGTVIELPGQPRVIAADIVGTDEEGFVGFLDEERAVFRGGIVLSVPQITVIADPWNGTRSAVRVRVGRGATAADDVVVSGLGQNLILATPNATQFLGYRDLGGDGFVRVTGDMITIGVANRVLWLDEQLRDHRTRDIVNDATGGLAVDDHRLLKATYTYLEENRSRLDVSLLDAETGIDVPLDTFSQSSTIAYDPRTQVFAVFGYSPTVSRARLDIAAGKVVPLRALKTQENAIVENLDPAEAGGKVAVTWAYVEGAIVIETFVDDNKSTRAISPAFTSRVPEGTTFGVDRRGTAYVMSNSDGKKQVHVHLAGTELRQFPVHIETAGGAVDRAGTQVAAYTQSAMAVYDVEGKERWRVPVWMVGTVQFTADGKKLLVHTRGGLIMLDAATGARLATGCGWGFGLSSVEPGVSVFLAPVVCAEGK